MNITLFKYIAFTTVLCTGLAGGMLAMRMRRLPGGQKMFSMGNAFSGGIFLGAGFLHMLPDAGANLRSAFGNIDFPWVYLICAAGFLVVFSIEKVFTRGHDGLSAAAREDRHGKFSPYLLAIVLSVHSIIAGIALGIEDGVAKAAVILLAVVAHKGSASFALTVNLDRDGVEKGLLRNIGILFSFMTPLGILLGVGFSALLQGRDEQIVEFVFDSMAAGTFLYVAFIDIIEEEFAIPDNRVFKFILLNAGLGLMAVLAMFL